MTKQRLFGVLFPVYILFSLVPNSGYASPLRCEQVFENPRGIPEFKVEWKNDKSYIETTQRKEAFGQVGTYFSKKWDTQVFHTNTGMVNARGESPLVDPDAKGVFIFFHGSGTAKSSGKNFISNMNNLATLGYSAVSFDMPFHANGPRSEEFYKADHFMEWVRDIVLEVKKSGKPVYLAGHSFGPDVMLEFITRYPKLVDGAAALSPAGFTKELSDWYDKYTSKMEFGGNVVANDAGGEWAGAMSQQFKWSKSKLADPTVVNPKLRLRILSGGREEYVPAPLGGPGNTPTGDNTYDVSVPLKKIFKNVIVTIEPGIGHYIFDHKDQDGLNVVLREILLVAGENPTKTREIAERVAEERKLYNPAVQLGKKYAQDPLFQAWAKDSFGERAVLNAIRQNQDGIAQKMMTEYSFAQKARDEEIYKKILATPVTHPEFYAKYKAQIDKLNPKKVETTLFTPYLLYVLNGEQ